MHMMFYHELEWYILQGVFLPHAWCSQDSVWICAPDQDISVNEDGWMNE